MRLSDGQEEIVRKFVDAHKLKLKTLRDDIIDHLCCVIENELEKKKSFEQILNEAVAELAPEGLKELESKTIFILNFKRMLIMEKLKYSIGFLGSLALTGGAVFKLLHLPGANELFMMGYLTFFLAFFPFLTFGWYKGDTTKMLSERLKIVLGGISSILLGLAGVFKILQLQESHWLLMVGIIIFASGFLPFLFFSMYKRAFS